MSNYLQHYGSPRIMRRLSLYYIMHYMLSAPSFHHIGQFLASNFAECGPWGERHVAYGLFNTTSAFRRLSTEAMKAEQGPRKFIESIGFTGSLGASNLAGEAFMSSCAELRKSLKYNKNAIIDIRKICDWAIMNKGFAYAGIPRAKSTFVESLLMPWLDNQPSDAVKEYILESLLRLFRDPRISPQTWTGISEDAISVMYRWLTKASLEQFLAVVDGNCPPTPWGSGGKAVNGW